MRGNLYHLLFSASLLQLVTSFNWKSCDENAAIKIESLSVGQNQTMVVQVKGQGSLTVDIQPPVQGNLIVQKKMFWGWTKVPCINGIGSCSYDDVCALTPYKNDCPSNMVDQGLPCKCPINKGPYGGRLTIDMKTVDLPKWLEKGNYRIKALMRADQKPLLCLQLEMTLK